MVPQKLRILFDIGHPAHIHLFRCFAREMEKEGHSILFTTRDKDITLRLLEEYGFPFVCLGKARKGIAGKVMGMFQFNIQLWQVARKFRPDLFMSHGSIYAAQVSALMGKRHISFEDTGNMEQILLYKPFTDAILVSDSFSKDFGKKTVVYSGYHELAYLHPKRFSPDQKIPRQYGIDPTKDLILMRFVSWEATHDIRHTGVPIALKRKAVDRMSRYGRVLITSEKELPEDLQPYQIEINPIHIFHIMAYCRLVFGESATMASEAAVLGVPAIYIDSTSRDYTREQEQKYGLVFNFSEDPEQVEGAIAQAEQILKEPKLREKFIKGRQKLLEDKIDVTGFLKGFVLSFTQKSLNDNNASNQ